MKRGRQTKTLNILTYAVLAASVIALVLSVISSLSGTAETEEMPLNLAPSNEMDDVVEMLLGNLNSGTYTGTSEVLYLKLDWNNKARGYIDYLDWDRSIWYAEVHKFNVDGSTVYLFKHINPYGSSKSYWDSSMEFMAFGFAKYTMATDGDGWVYAPDGDFSGNLFHQPFDNMMLNHINWKGDELTVRWDGARTKTNEIPHDVFMSPSPLYFNGDTDFCRSWYDSLGSIRECDKGAMQYEKFNSKEPVMWMEEFKDMQFKNILFPGTHDAGAYTLSGKVMIDPFGNVADNIQNKITQKYNLYEQLMLGIRLQDWRPAYVENDRWYLYHNGIGPAIGPSNNVGKPGSGDFSKSFRDNYALRQVRAFMDKVNDKHVLVILYLQNPKGIALDSFDPAFEQLMDEAEVELGTYLYNVSNGTIDGLYEKTIAEITSDGAKVIFLFDKDTPNQFKSSDYNHPDRGFWQTSIATGYFGSESDMKNLANKEKEFLSQGFSDRDFVNLNWVRTVGLAQMGIFHLKDMAPETNGYLGENKWVEDNSHIPQSDLNKVNTYTVDYFEIGETLGFAIRQNRKRP